MAVLRNIQHGLLSSDAHSGIPQPPEKRATGIQEGGKDYLLSERSEKENKVIQGKSDAVCAGGEDRLVVTQRIGDE